MNSKENKENKETNEVAAKVIKEKEDIRQQSLLVCGNIVKGKRISLQKL